MTFINKFYYLLTALVVFIIYLFTLAPSVVQIDSGELAAVQATLGIAHPTGYPLYTIIGYLFSLIPLPFAKIYQLNLLAAIYCSAAAGVFTFTVKLCIDNIKLFRNQKKKPEPSGKKKQKKNKQRDEQPVKQDELSETTKIISAVFGGLALAFSKTFWFQGTSVEVYSLHLLLITLIILFLIKAYVITSENEELKPWLVFAVFLALGFTNHMTTLLILPGTAYLYFSKYKFSKDSFIRIGKMLLIFFPVFIIIYSYLPIRASMDPAMNWGNPTNLEKLSRHISGKQYQVWLFSSFDAAEKQLSYFFKTLPDEFLLTLFLSVIGIFISFIKAKKLGVFLFITLVVTVLYSINYDIHDIDSYFLLAYIMLAFFAVIGVIKIIEMNSLQWNIIVIVLAVWQAIQFLHIYSEYNIGLYLTLAFITLFFFAVFGALKIIKIKFIQKKISIIIIVTIIFTQVYFNFVKVNQSSIYTFEGYTKTILSSVPNNSIVFSYQWDYFVSATYYFQLVENYRPDVTVVDKELLRRSWYYNELNTRFPDLLHGVRNEVDQFLKELQPFERSENYNAQKLEVLYRGIMTDLIFTNADNRDYFIGPELIENEMQKGEFTLPAGYNLVPYSVLYKVVKGNEYVPEPDMDFKIRFHGNTNDYIENIKGVVSGVRQNRAVYELRNGNREKAVRIIKKLKAELPNIKLHPSLQELIN